MSTNMVYLISNDGERTSVAKDDLIFESKLAKETLDNDTELNVDGASSNTIKNVVTFINIQREAMENRFLPLPFVTDEEKKKKMNFDFNSVNKVHSDYVKSFSIQELSEIALVAHYLDMPALMDLVCAYFASILNSHTVEENRNIFKIQNDFTPGEEERIQSENQWWDEQEQIRSDNQ